MPFFRGSLAEVWSAHIRPPAFAHITEVFAAREALATGVSNVRITPLLLSTQLMLFQVEEIREISEEIKSCKTRISQIIESNKVSGDGDLLRAQYFLHTLRVFEAEMMAQLKDWDQLSRVVAVRQFHSPEGCIKLKFSQDAVTSGPLAVATYEAIADILVCHVSSRSANLTNVDSMQWAEKDCPVHRECSIEEVE